MDSDYRPSFAGQKRNFSHVEPEKDDEDDYKPSFSFRPFAPAPPPTTSQSPSPPTISIRGSAKRPAWKKANSGASTPGGGGGGGGGFASANSFAARMMAKMGYKEGQGLGATGQGIVKPVESVLRPQGIGLGAVKEMSQQAKDEAKREAARRGEVLIDSSDEERTRRKARKEERRKAGIASGSGSGTSTPRGPAKPKFRTAREMEADTAGLEVPSVLKSLIDATGKEQKLLTSTAGLMAPLEFVSAEEGEARKIAQRARHDLEAFADEWKGLSERKTFVELEEAQIAEEINTTELKIERLMALSSAIRELEHISLKDNLYEKWEETTLRLEQIETDYENDIDEFHLSEIAVAALHPLFRQAMDEWEPLNGPTHITTLLDRLQPLVSRKQQRGDAADDEKKYRPRQSTTPYETMIYTLWLPKVRTALLNDWDVHDSLPATAIVEAWKHLVPEFVYSNVLNQLVVPKLSIAIKEWRPRGSSSGRKTQNGTSQQFPWWIFDWLRYLDERHTDPKAPTGLMSDVKRKFRTILDSWNLSRGLIDRIDLWRDILGSEFHTALRNHMLPRLAGHLREDFDVNPQDQQLDAYEDVLKWKDYFKPGVFGMLLTAEFFPKWHAVLHLWLTSDPNYEEVGQWFSWWKSQIPEEINKVDEVRDEWNRALEMMNLALDLGDRAKTELPAPPPAGGASEYQQRRQRQVRGREPGDRKKAISAAAAPEGVGGGGARARRPSAAIEEPTFRDVVEDWCAGEGLIMLPLREAQVQSGLPLFRITASASGKGGVVVYLKGDVVWAQNRKARELFEPVGLDSKLIARAEGGTGV